MRALGALKQHRLSSIDRFIDDESGVDNVAFQTVGVPHVLLVDLFQFKTLYLMELFEQPIDVD